MNPKNFPARKLARQAKAQGRVPTAAELTLAASKRTKKQLATASEARRARRRGRI